MIWSRLRQNWHSARAESRLENGDASEAAIHRLTRIRNRIRPVYGTVYDGIFVSEAAIDRLKRQHQVYVERWEQIRGPIRARIRIRI